MTVDVPSHLRDRDRHGDADAQAGLVDFAVNVRPGPPEFIARMLRERVADLAAYPSAREADDVARLVAHVHHRSPDEVLLLGGAAEGFELLAHLRPQHVAVIAPSFTEPERVLSASNARITHVTLDAPWRLADAVIPEDADLVVFGNPTNPTSVLHSRADVLALRRPGRIVVVDEAFADLTLDGDRREPESVAAERADDLIVVRSVTKTFGLAGLRAGYLLAAPDLIARMTAGRRHWAVGTLTLAALAACAGPEGQAYARSQAHQVADERAHLLARLSELGLAAEAEPRAPYVMVKIPQAWQWKHELAARGFSVRSCANFEGLDADHLRLAVRPREVSDALVDAMQDVKNRLETGAPTR
ncbi:Rv2231c family pyridoxal phosphate-dependent protein CobC [Gordonia sp. HY002]|uniref:Rv2231c family pyridoxal phosphate-dependent protein CobC n=1 Tax=Gordonia zhenghanii TaxID=2911516 RepID=UPI001EEFA22C|nr:Rv2231c family pyridoxal phosphate-dependent protein CobC [Gordonia zhenghanii]MCF8570850.1 Rv2231c family pyridoxal phosphate-dependent protein CobC [Gordonia zhenghanii]MCF8607402.1 Rv2231c family pyridoxal phosphate-dependent protein CobC [Gordonia zhenghanii]